MAIVPVSVIYRGITQGVHGIGENFANVSRDNFANPAWDGFAYTGGGIAFDLITSESHKMENSIPTHPVQNGVDITDHIRNKLREGSLVGLISNFSLFAGPLNPFSGYDRKVTAYQLLGNMWQRRTLVDLVTVMEVYKNVAIKSISMSRDGTTGEAQDFEIEFTQVSVRNLRSVTGMGKVAPSLPVTPEMETLDTITAQLLSVGTQLTV